MKKIFLALTSVLTALVLPGCFQSETTIHLNKDGSGTLIEETKLGAQMIAMIDQMAAGFGGGGDKAKPSDPVKNMLSEEKATQRAAELGEGVTFEKAEPVEANGAKGARITYKFKDINKLKISSADGMKNASPMGDMADMPGIEKPKKQQPIQFTYAGGTLNIKMPRPTEEDLNKAKDAPAIENKDMPDMGGPEAQAMMKQMFADSKMSLKLVIDPGISETDATHKDGNTITLVEMNFGKLMENADTFKKLQKIDQKDPAKAMDALKTIDGVKFETKDVVTVKVN